MINEQELKEAVRVLTEFGGELSDPIQTLLSLARAVLEAKVVEKIPMIDKAYTINTRSDNYKIGWNAATDATRLVVARDYVRKDALPTDKKIESALVDACQFMDGIKPYIIEDWTEFDEETRTTMGRIIMQLRGNEK